MWKQTISFGVSWFLSDSHFLIWIRLHFIFWVNQRWICWCPHVSINVSVITPWKVPYLWDPWG